MEGYMLGLVVTIDGDVTGYAAGFNEIKVEGSKDDSIEASKEGGTEGSEEDLKEGSTVGSTDDSIVGLEDGLKEVSTEGCNDNVFEEGGTRGEVEGLATGDNDGT